jgi:His/Glu/Gln/Arg/opine family amino acid ABC transporter permease subunit
VSGSWGRAFVLFPHFAEVLLLAAITTVVITIGGFLIAMILGLAFGVLKTSHHPTRRAIATIYVEIFRSVPVLTQLFIIYFGLGEMGLRLDPLSAAIIGFGINGGAYLTEVFRSGIEAVHKGQMEASFAIGMTRPQAMRYIIVPQAVRIVLPPLGNYVIGLLKETSIASAVAAPELMYQAGTLIRQSFLSSQIYLMVAIIYLCMSLPMSRLVRHFENRMGKGRSAGGAK